MRIQNPLHFTEQHHFCVCRDFSLSPVDYRMLSSVYQPMVGSRATGLYMLLFQQIPSDRIGYSAPEQQRKLFLGMDLEPSEKGRKMLAEQASRLEATGLLESKRHYLPEYDDYLYIYRLYPPLSPSEFFQTQHLALLLRDKVGSHTAAALRESFRQPMPEEADEERASYTEDLSVPFYELFQLNAQAAPPDEPEERVQKEIRPDHGVPKGVSAGRYRFEYADIISRFPRHSANRGYVENLKYEPGQLEAIHYISVKYDLTLPELCRLLDEDGVFNGKGELSLDTLQKKASATFRQDKKREEERAVF